MIVEACPPPDSGRGRGPTETSQLANTANRTAMVHSTSIPDICSRIYVKKNTWDNIPNAILLPKAPLLPGGVFCTLVIPSKFKVYQQQDIIL